MLTSRMRTFTDGELGDRGAIWAVGNFDGLHRGHQELLAHARAIAASKGVSSGVLTFTPHPARVLSPDLAPLLILTEDEKANEIARFGIDVLCPLPFDAELAAMSATSFAQQVLVERLGVGGVVVGEGFRFGYRAAGTVDDLRAALPIVDVVPPVREGDLICSSTKIRELVMEGRVDVAARLLGGPYWLSGVVITGDMRGRTIGIPTANLDVKRELLPKVGVYATLAILEDGRRVKSVTNIGLRPTFQGQGVRIEAHLLDFEEDLYGQRLRLDVMARIRDEMRFPGVHALVEQIERDIISARALLQ